MTASHALSQLSYGPARVRRHFTGANVVRVMIEERWRVSKRAGRVNNRERELDAGMSVRIVSGFVNMMSRSRSYRYYYGPLSTGGMVRRWAVAS